MDFRYASSHERHGSRQAPAWLIFDVSQKMKRVAILMLFFSASMLMGASDIERQFRADIEVILTSDWPNSRATKFTGERFQKLVDEILEGTKAQSPVLFRDAPRDENPSDAILKGRYSEMLRVKKDEDRREDSFAPMTLFYLKGWRSNTLTRLQRVIFLRYLDEIITDVERNRRELERIRKKG
jgi:hypothetical protein